MHTIWFITGTGSGLGEALKNLLTGIPNHFVYGLSRRELPDAANYKHIAIDLSQQQPVLDFEFPEIAEGFRVVLVNNAAQLGQILPIGGLDDLDIIHTCFLNAIAPLILSNKFLHAYHTQAKETVIINLSSGAATHPYDGWGLYCSTKAALQMQAQVMHAEAITQKHATRIYAFAPGVLQTNMQAEIRGADSEHFSRKQKFIDLYAKGALVEPLMAAKDILKLVEHPQLYKECIYRFPL
jgi:benzil reductase ((S)-benzoin forming)